MKKLKFIYRIHGSYSKDPWLTSSEKLFVVLTRMIIRDKKRGISDNYSIQKLGNYFGIDSDIYAKIEKKIKEGSNG